MPSCSISCEQEERDSGKKKQAKVGDAGGPGTPTSSKSKRKRKQQKRRNSLSHTAGTSGSAVAASVAPVDAVAADDTPPTATAADTATIPAAAADAQPVTAAPAAATATLTVEVEEVEPVVSSDDGSDWIVATATRQPKPEPALVLTSAKSLPSVKKSPAKLTIPSGGDVDSDVVTITPMAVPECEATDPPSAAGTHNERHAVSLATFDNGVMLEAVVHDAVSAIALFPRAAHIVWLSHLIAHVVLCSAWRSHCGALVTSSSEGLTRRMCCSAFNML